MFEAAAGTALTFILLMFYFDLKKIAGYAWIVDIAVFALTLWLFKGTYAGMMTGMLAGLMITFFLKGVRRVFGYKVLKVTRAPEQLVPMPRWVDVPPQYIRSRK